MATPFHVRRTTQNPDAIPERGGYLDMTAALPTTSAGLKTPVRPGDPTLPDGSMQFTKGICYCDRFVNQDTISGAITFNLLSEATATDIPMRFRVRVSKVTFGGGNVETLILQSDAPTDIAVSTGVATNWSATPPAPVTVVPNERLILRVYVFAPGGGTWTTGTIDFRYDGLSGGPYFSHMDLTETIATRPNQSILFLRRTTTIGIGGFMDWLDVKGTLTNTTAVVNTAAGGTEIQWTKTAGGALAEWISPRVYGGLSIASATDLQGQFTALESNVSANLGLRAKVFRRTPAGVESLIGSWDTATEMVTGATVYNLTATPLSSFTATVFEEDDRLVFRAYIIPLGGTMGGGQTGTLWYDHNSASNGTAGHSWVRFLPNIGFKAESTPNRPLIPSGQSTVGLGNGQ